MPQLSVSDKSKLGFMPSSDLYRNIDDVTQRDGLYQISRRRVGIKEKIAQ